MFVPVHITQSSISPFFTFAFMDINLSHTHMLTFASTVAEDHDDEEWAEEAQESPELEQQLSSMTLSSNTSERSHEERLEMFFNFTEVI